MIKYKKDLIKVNRVDEIGDCFKSKGHYYRQQKHSVLHVYTGVVNLLDENAIQDNRVNWDKVVTKISSKEFNTMLTTTLNSMFDD